MPDESVACAIGPRLSMRSDAGAFLAACYLVVMVEVMDLTTMVAILNCASRLQMLCRLAIQSKSVHTAQTSPLSS